MRRRIALVVVLLLVPVGGWVLTRPNLICEPHKAGCRPHAWMQTIAGAESMFQARNGRYGTLQELADAQLITPELGKGLVLGYVFQAAPNPAAPTSSWFAVANPGPHTDEVRSCATNESGLIVMSNAPIAFSSTGTLPLDREGVRVLGR